MASKLDKQVIINEFDSLWEPHTFCAKLSFAENSPFLSNIFITGKTGHQKIF